MTADPDDIRAWQRLDARTTTSGRLQQGDLARLAAIGTRHVINLALDSHPDALADEGAMLAALGIGYTHIPVPFDTPTEAHFEQFCATLAACGDAPVHVHCIMNWRVSAFFYRLNRDHRGMDAAQARALMEAQWAPDRSAETAAHVWADFIR
ncbi:MAG: protein tyrosine phosphatase family protein [Sphingomonadaceae bacterium]